VRSRYLEHQLDGRPDEWQIWTQAIAEDINGTTVVPEGLDKGFQLAQVPVGPPLEEALLNDHNGIDDILDGRLFHLAFVLGRDGPFETLHGVDNYQ